MKNLSSLEAYLEKQFHTDQQQVSGIDSLLEEVASTLTHVFKDGQWPYHHEVKKPEIATEEGRVSQGTMAMTLVAAGRLLGKCELAGGAKAQIGLKKGISKKLKGQWETALKNLSEDPSVKRGNVVSGTFGNENPITYSHIIELMRVSSEAKKKITAVFSEADKRLDEILDPQSDFHKTPLEPGGGLEPGGNNLKYQKNAFVPLRVMRAAQDSDATRGSDIRTNIDSFREYFESTLHDQLSFSAIPDSRFDPAELLFCLEGLLLCEPSAVDQTLFKQILDVLSDKQETSAHWRPSKPFFASDKGQLMLPLSVEGANSLIRSIDIMNGDRLYDTYTEQCVPLLKRFWRWLSARVVRFKMGDTSCAGWHSEHINQPDIIHIWDTSQILDFMLGYRQLLQKHMADKTLVLSGVQVGNTQRKKTRQKVVEWEDSASEADTWDPVSCLHDRYKTYTKIKDDFLLGWEDKEPEDNKPKNYSMLLYGPPGTGKTSVAENISSYLGFRMITITVSDFLGLGGALVEARVKAVFEMLKLQQDTVILFDEIDTFLLDRDSELYRNQETIFQFLTPGMLTKINDLRKKEGSIFIIATNYENRIDPAIKRPGRIDKKYLLLCPDGERRKDIFRGQMHGEDGSFEDHDDLRKLKESSNFLGFPDIKNIVGALEKPTNLDEVIARALEAPRSTGIEKYLQRYAEEKQEFPWEELACLIAIHEPKIDGVEKFKVVYGPEISDTKFNADDPSFEKYLKFVRGEATESEEPNLDAIK